MSTIYTCGVFLINKKTKRILLGHPTNSPKNTYSIPKGVMNPKEGDRTPKETAFRELKEETNILIYDGDIELYSKFIGEYKYSRRNKVLVAYSQLVTPDFLEHQDIKCLSMVNPGFKPNDSFPEFDKFIWATYDDALTKVHITQKYALKKLKKMELI